MTIFFPDVSNFQAALRIQPGTGALIAKASEGTYYTDASYAGFKAQAAAVGSVFSAYHFLTAGDGAGQADYCHAIVGATPVMLDVEPEGASKPSVADCAAFIARMHQLGGRVWGVYYPRWYWSQTGGDLASLGVALIASGYPGGYSDSDANWNAYGGKTPDVWQYTDKQPYAGQSVDFNAYRGSLAGLANLICGTTTPTGGTSMPNIPASIGQKWPDIASEFPANAAYNDGTALIWADGGARAAALYARQARDAINTLAGRLGQPTAIDVNALAAALAPHLTAGATPDQLAQAVVAHFAADLQKG